jgi:mannose-1-phosphate guanylyltransferase
LKAILLSAGIGKRLRPFTYDIPKCLIPIKGKPILQIWLEKLTSIGVNQFLINTHYLHDKVYSFITNSIFKDKVKIIYENKLLGTAGTLIKNIDFVKNEKFFFFLHVDNYTTDNLKNFLNYHNKNLNNNILTMMTFKTLHPKSCGIVIKDEKNVLVDYFEKVKKPPGNEANAAIYIISHKLISFLKKSKGYIDFSKDIVPELVNKILCYKTEKMFNDIGSVMNYAKFR